ncbi:DUF6808 domain-containing protein [uncultured Alistipes sp.]|jgi:hypothetical protein|uniref:DUF6808 domain-containing protein n=1 Tax=uncultured Alistipes sp. TaxID=538949 RepID=UPI0025F42B63|nr:hypothetical protein [uncultured Alistipes sp.]
MKTLVNCALLAVFFFLGYYFGRDSIEVQTDTKVEIHTVYYERPQPVNTSRSLVSVNIPKLLFAPADTLRETVLVHIGQDSAQLQLAIEKRMYEDSTYRAQVSGPAVGEYGPSLDWIEIYNRQTIRTTTVRDPYKWEIGSAAGAWYANSGGSVWIGAQMRRNFGRLNLTASGGWDPNNGGTFVQATAGLTLWRK